MLEAFLYGPASVVGSKTQWDEGSKEGLFHQPRSKGRRSTAKREDDFVTGIRE